MNKNIITAIEIQNNQKLIETEVNELVLEFNKSRLRRELKIIRDNRKSRNEDIKFSKEEKEIILSDLINDNESLIFKKEKTIQIENKRLNYDYLRSNIQDLNDLNEFSAEVEINEIQNHLKCLLFEDIIKIDRSKLLKKFKIERENNINNYIDKLSNLNSSANRALELLINMRNIYQIKNDIDDIELFEKFEMLSNIDMSNELSDIILSNPKYNIINDLVTKNIKINSIKNFVKRQIISNKLLGILLSSSSDINNKQNFITNNKVTTLKTTYTNNINNEYIYTTRTLGELLFEITNEELSNIDKTQRQQIYMTYDGKRPSSHEYHKWNGLQVFDIDLKLWLKEFPEASINFLKEKMYRQLSNYNWFLWIVTSASGNGIHIYTKVSPFHHIFTNSFENELFCKYWYNINYTSKSSVIYEILFNLHDKNVVNFGSGMINNELKYLDNIVRRITSGIRLTYDDNPLINHNFVDLHIGLNINQTEQGYSQDNIKTLFLRNTKLQLNLLENIEGLVEQINNKDKQDSSEDEIDLTKYVTLGLDTEKITSLPKSKINYITRYNVCNTLADLMGKDGLDIAHHILNSKECSNIGEINSFYSCAISNRKKASAVGLEILKKCGIIKDVKPELKEETDNIFKSTIKRAIEQTLDNKLDEVDYELSKYQYLTDIKDKIICNDEIVDDFNIFDNQQKEFKSIVNNKINIIFSPPASGKTTFIKQLAKEGERILLVLPYISVIKNKIETDPEIMDLFTPYYGDKDIKKLEYGENAVITIDKFSRVDYEKISRMFKYIFIDESHLLFTSSYRVNATSNTLKRIKELFFISRNDPFAAKLVLMTGTETGETYFFDDVANVIKVNKPTIKKDMEFLICDDLLDAITRLSTRVVKWINEGKKVIIPTNKGEGYSAKLIGMIQYLLGREVKWGYYKRSNNEQEICKIIDENNSIGDYEIIFATNYLSVGIDINDKYDFASAYVDNFSGFEIEQFNARIRKSGITSIYCIKTQTSTGEINPYLLEEPQLALRLTDEDKMNFVDDKQIANAKSEFLAMYDPILKQITTPGFSVIQGKLMFDPENYELTMFENKFMESMEHPIKIARELSKYGYKISVSTEYDGLSEDEKSNLLSIGLDAQKNEKLKRHQLMVGTFLSLIENNTYVNEYNLEMTNVIEWIMKNQNYIVEDRDLDTYIKIDYNMMAVPIRVVVKSRKSLDTMIRDARYLISKYSVNKCIQIINEYVDEKGNFKHGNFKRSINLLKLVDASDYNELAEPTRMMLEKIYNFIDIFEANKDYRISYNYYKAKIEEWTSNFIDNLGIKITTPYAFNKIKDSIVETLNDVATKKTSKRGITFEYNKLPDQDSSNVVNRRSVDNMVQQMFQITSENNKKSKTRLNHIIIPTNIDY